MQRPRQWSSGNLHTTRWERQESAPASSPRWYRHETALLDNPRSSNRAVRFQPSFSKHMDHRPQSPTVSVAIAVSTPGAWLECPSAPPCVPQTMQTPPYPFAYRDRVAQNLV